MIRLEHIREVMRPQFIWDNKSNKPLQLDDNYENNKELARTIFVGLADMYSFPASDVMTFLDCGYDSYRHKLMEFRTEYKVGKARDDRGELRDYDDSANRLYVKTCLCLNAIAFKTQRSPYIKMNEYVNI